MGVWEVILEDRSRVNGKKRPWVEFLLIRSSGSNERGEFGVSEGFHSHSKKPFVEWNKKRSRLNKQSEKFSNLMRGSFN